MKKMLLICLVLVFNSCSLKDDNGNAPLIMNEEGLLVDNPDFEDNISTEPKEARENYKATFDDVILESNIPLNPTIKDREEFAKVFKPKTGKTEIELSGKDKTTIKLRGYMVPYTVEQYENLNYYELLKNMGFKKVIFLFGDTDKVVATKDL